MFSSSLIDKICNHAIALNTPKRYRWTKEEHDYLIKNHLRKTDHQIGEALGRSIQAVKVRRHHYDMASYVRMRTDLMTMNHASKIMGIEVHAMSHWCTQGFISSFQPADLKMVRVIYRRDLIQWAVNPDNWIYFDWRHIKDLHIRRLCELRSQRWGDEWWTTKQAAEYLGCTPKDVSRHIDKLKTLPGKQSPLCKSGRHPNRKWAYWYVKKSDVLNYTVKSVAKGSDFSKHTPRSDAWILKARDQLGLSWAAIGRTMHLTGTTVANRYKKINGTYINKRKRGAG